MTSSMMTFLGALGAMLAFIQVGLTAMHDVPQWTSLVIGAFNAGITYYLGQTNKGTVAIVESSKTLQADNIDKSKIK